MYLHVPNSGNTPTDLQLTFNFGSSSSEIRAWNILVSMIACDSTNLGTQIYQRYHLDSIEYYLIIFVYPPK